MPAGKHSRGQIDAFIYSLRDPETGAVWYVGLTRNPKNRMRQWKNDPGHTQNLKSWLASLREAGLTPIMKIEEQCEENVSSDRERFWISYFLGCDEPLMNITSGGESGWKLPEEASRIHRGDCNGNSKLSEQKVREIMALKGTDKASSIGAKFGVSTSCVHAIHNEQLWRHIWEDNAGHKNRPAFRVKISSEQARKGAKARFDKMTPQEKRDLAIKAARSRWGVSQNSGL